MNYERCFASRVKEIEASTIRYFFSMASNVEGAISLTLGEPDFKTPDFICDAACKALKDGKTFYAPTTGIFELREEIAAYLKANYCISYDPEDEIIVTIGASQAIDIAMRSLVDEGDEVLIPEPSFIFYSPCAKMAAGIPVCVPTYADDDFVLRAEILESYITPASKVIVIPYPNNPTGAVMTSAQLNEIAEVVKKHDLIVITDEIYSELIYDGHSQKAFASLPEMWERTVTINGFSKSYAMTGWRLGYLAAPKPIAEEIAKAHQYNVACASTPSQYAGIVALREGKSSIEFMRREYDKRRKFVLKSLRDMGLKCFEPRGAFYVFPSVEELGVDSKDFCMRLLHEGKVAVVPGNAFGNTGEGHIRLSYASSMENLAEALRRMESFVGSL